MDYRREIDGLRALAVLPVILFHAGFEPFSGGFVGVDVFFVISGYLITAIILAELELGKFSIVNFYERRARRILPALFFVMLACIPFAWLWLLPSDMKDFSQSLVAVSVFASNILFWRQSGYFDISAELKPLLHTWSLAVEEQYYVLFPLFLMQFWRLGKHWILVTLGLVFVLSLGVAQWAAYAKPAAAFYLLPTRGWELLIGAFAAFYLSKADRKDFSKAVSEVGGWLGIVLILYTVFAYSKATPFPGLYALVPTLGTVLVILFATQQTKVGRFVGNKAFVSVGLISYSAYLWHQPLFAFARHISSTELSFIDLLVLIALTFCLAYITYQWVERPFRRKLTLSKISIFKFSISSITLFLLIGFVGSYFNIQLEKYYVNNRLTDDQSKMYWKFKSETNYDMYTYQRHNSECHFWRPTYESLSLKDIKDCRRSTGFAILVIGDSHAMNLYNVLTVAFPNHTIVGVSQGYCRLSDWVDYCHPNLTFNFLSTHKDDFDRIIYHQTGSVLIDDRMALSRLTESLTVLKSIARNKLQFIGPWVEGRTRYIDIVSGRRQKIRDDLVEKFSHVDSLLINISSQINIDYFSMFELLKNLQINLVDKGCLLYRDNNHLSRCAETLIGENFRASFQKEIFNH